MKLTQTSVSGRRTRRTSIVVSLFTVVVAVAACSSSKSSNSGTSAGGSGAASVAGNTDTVKVGTVVPLTGAAAATAGQYLSGLEAAVDAANAAGGVNGHHIDMTKVDDAFQVPRTISGVKELAQKDDVVGIVGPYGTNAAVAAVPIASQVKVPLVGALAYAQALYKPVNPYVFPLFPSQTAIFQALTEYAITKLGAKRVAVMANDGEVGNETWAGAEAALKAHGLSPIVELREANAQPDYSGLLSQIAALKPDAVIVQSDTPSLATILKNAKNSNLTAPFFGGVASADASLTKLIGAAADGNYGIVNINLTGTAPGWSDYTAAIGKYTQTDPTSSFAASGYTAGQVLLGAIAKVSGEVTTEKLTKALSNNTFQTLAGPIKYTANDHLGSPKMLLTKIVGGKVTLTGDTLPAAS